ncbi:putative ribonuclease H-like domain-containing protein, partial [Tanacetum coccineum]
MSSHNSFNSSKQALFFMPTIKISLFKEANNRRIWVEDGVLDTENVIHNLWGLFSKETVQRVQGLGLVGNEESTKKMKKTMLKQQFAEFSVIEEEGLHKGYDRFQKILSQLNQVQLMCKCCCATPHSAFIGTACSGSKPTYSDQQSIVPSVSQTSGRSDNVDQFEKDRAGRIDETYNNQQLQIDRMEKVKSDDKQLWSHVDSMVNWSVRSCRQKNKTGECEKVQNCPLCCDSKINDLNNMYNNLDRLYNDCYIKVQAYQNAVKTLESQKDWYHKTQIALEEKIRILSANLENTTNTLSYTEKLHDQAQTEKKEWEVKFEATLARFEKWKESSKNLQKLINSSMSTRTKIGLGFKEYFGKDEVFDLSTPSVFDPEPVEEDKPLYSWFVKAGEMHAVPPSITGTYMPTSYKSDIEDTQVSYGSKSDNKTSEILSESNDFVSCDNSDKSSDSETYASCDSSLKTKTNNFPPAVDITTLPESDIEDPNSTTGSPSFSCLENVKSPRIFCNKSGMNNRNVCKNNSVRVKKCFVCGSKLHLIKDCDFYNCVDSVPCKFPAASVSAGSRNSSASVPAGRSDSAASRNRPAVNSAGGRNSSASVPAGRSDSAASRNRPAVISAGGPNPAGRSDSADSRKRPAVNSAGGTNHAGWYKRPASVSAGRPVSAGWINPAARPYFRPSSVYFNNQTNFYDPMFMDKGRWGTAGDPSTDNDIGIVDSGCSRSMTGNKEKLDDFVQIKGGIVKFGGGDGRISGKGTIRTSKLDFENVYYVEELQHFNLFSVSQICDKKNKVLFTDTDCLVLSEEFQLPDASQVVLRIPRKHDLYTFHISDLQPEQKVTCFVAKASLDESTRWHRRMAHVNFKTINKLAKEGLVDGLPLKVFTNEHNCVACNKGKQHKASYKHISAVRLITDTLQLLHMDLFGPTNIRSIDQKYYSLVVTDDFSRFSWTFFLGTKDETFYVLKEFITLIENQLNKKVKGIRCDNGTEFKNAKLIELCGEKGIKRDYSNPRTPQQNGVAERKNRTLIEAARTMLADSKLPTMFWTEAVSTACYVLNRVSITNPHNKTPYELISGKVPQISHLKPFGCQVTILNTSDYLGKFEGKADDGYLVGYASNSKAYRVYNLPNKRVEETLNLRFLEDKPNVQGIGHEWYFDLDYLTDSLGYTRFKTDTPAGTHETNINAGTQDHDSDSEVDEQVIVVPSFPSNRFAGPSSSNGPRIMERNADYAEDGPRFAYLVVHIGMVVNTAAGCTSFLLTVWFLLLSFLLDALFLLIAMDYAADSVNMLVGILLLVDPFLLIGCMFLLTAGFLLLDDSFLLAEYIPAAGVVYAVITSIHAAGLISAGGIMFLLADLFLLVVTCFYCAQLNIAGWLVYATSHLVSAGSITKTITTEIDYLGRDRGFRGLHRLKWAGEEIPLSPPMLAIAAAGDAADEPNAAANEAAGSYDTILGGFHEESLCWAVDASYTSQMLLGVQRSRQLLLTSLSAKIDRCMGRIDSLETELGTSKKIMGGAILTLVSRVKKLERTVKQLRTARLVGDAPATEGDVDIQDEVDLEGLSRMASEAMGHDHPAVPSEDIEEREEEEVPLRRKRSVHRRARTAFNTSAFAQFHAPLSADVLSQAAASASAGPSGVADKGKAPMPDLDIPAEFVAEDAQARKRFEEEQASERLVQRLRAEDLAQEDLPNVSEERAKELDDLMMRMTETDWLNLMMQVGSNPALARELLGADVTEANFVERMTAIKERKKRALADLRYRALKGKPLKHSEVTQMMRTLVKNQWCAAHNGTITMKAVKAMSKPQLIEEYENICRRLEKDRLLSAQYNLFRPKPVISEPPSKRQRVDRDTSPPSDVPAASTHHADDPDSAGGGSFNPAGTATPMTGSAVPDTAGGTLGTTGTASTVPTSAAMDSAASHHELGISPFADSDDSSSPSPVSTDHIPIDVLFEPTPGGIHAFFLDSDEDEQIGLSRVATEPDSDDEVLAEILFRGQYVSGAGVVVVDKLPDDEIVDPRVKVEPISESTSSPPRSRSKHRGVRSDTSLWDRPVDDFLSSESESDDDIEDYIPPIPYGAFKDWEIVRCPLRNTYYHVYYQDNRRHKNFFYLKELLPHVYREDLLLLRRRMNRYFRLNPDVDVGLDLWRDVNLLCQSLHSDDVEDFWRTQDEWVVSGWRLYPKSSVHVLDLTNGKTVYMFVDKFYPIRAPLLERMLRHRLTVPPSYCRDVVVAGSVIQTIQDGLRESYECLASAPIYKVAKNLSASLTMFLETKSGLSNEGRTLGKDLFKISVLPGYQLEVITFHILGGNVVVHSKRPMLLLRDIVASFDSAVHRDHAGSFDAV